MEFSYCIHKHKEQSGNLESSMNVVHPNEDDFVLLCVQQIRTSKVFMPITRRRNWKGEIRKSRRTGIVRKFGFVLFCVP